MNIPEKVFIVPYRDRPAQKKVFIKIMSEILEDENYLILFIHQNDKRNFNRGAMKNIGFIYVKNTWPDNYKNITLIFHDIDVLPYYKGQINYNTEKGVATHLYGYTHVHALGGIWAIKAEDFEKSTGFANFWCWGFEDNIIYERCFLSKIKYDKSKMIAVNMKDTNLILLDYKNNRNYNPNILKNKSIFYKDNYSTIANLEYDNEKINNNTFIINVNKFNTPFNIENLKTKNLSKKELSTLKTHNWRYYAMKKNQYISMRKKQGLMPKII